MDRDHLEDLCRLIVEFRAIVEALRAILESDEMDCLRRIFDELKKKLESDDFDLPF